MKYSPQEIIQYAAEEDVKFIRLAFCDVYGKQKNISIMPGELAKAFEHGIGFDASAVRGFGNEARSDLMLFPDPDSPIRPSTSPAFSEKLTPLTASTFPAGVSR